MKIVEFAYMLIFEFTTEGRDDMVPDWSPHPQAIRDLRRDEVAETALLSEQRRRCRQRFAVAEGEERTAKTDGC